MSIPAAWLPAAAMTRVILHWTGGARVASNLDRQHYHFIVEGDGNLVRGDLPVTANQAPVRGNYAAHTRGCNTGSIGVSLAAMAGAVEQPWKAGPHPLTREAWESGVEVIAALCQRYKIEPTRKTVLTHAEVQQTLGIQQRGKWDIARLAFDPSVFGGLVVGDRLRRDVLAAIERGAGVPAKTEKLTTDGEMQLTGTVTAPKLNFRRAPDGEIVGSLPRGTRVVIVDHDRGWSEVRTPAGHVGFVSSRYLALA